MIRILVPIKVLHVFSTTDLFCFHMGLSLWVLHGLHVSKLISVPNGIPI